MVTNLSFGLEIESVSSDNNYPEVIISLDDTLLVHELLYTSKKYNFDVMLKSGHHSINVELVNKTPSDTKVDKSGVIVADKALIIKTVTIEGYSLSDFLHRAVYYPANRDSLRSNYLGWNGTWKLDIVTPIFTWIHKTQGLGWIYSNH
jgi:hypothetical protein